MPFIPFWFSSSNSSDMSKITSVFVDLAYLERKLYQEVMCKYTDPDIWIETWLPNHTSSLTQCNPSQPSFSSKTNTTYHRHHHRSSNNNTERLEWNIQLPATQPWITSYPTSGHAPSNTSNTHNSTPHLTSTLPYPRPTHIINITTTIRFPPKYGQFSPNIIKVHPSVFKNIPVSSSGGA